MAAASNAAAPRGRDELRGPRDTTRTSDAEPRPDTSTLTPSTEASACGDDAELGLDPFDADTVRHSADVSNQAIAGLPRRIIHCHTIHETDRQPEVRAPHGLGHACEAMLCDADDVEHLDDRDRRCSPAFSGVKVRPISGRTPSTSK
jgi:hypothetical protein